MPRHQPVFVHLLPALIPPGTLKGGLAVVIDVLRATTTMIQALASGAEAIYPCLEIDEARQVAASLPKGTALLAGERQGLPIDGFDLGNSPSACTPEVCSGRTLVMTTTNGTRAILASLEADRVFIAAFVNRMATLEALIADGRPVHLVCSGTDGLISLEDSMLAGSIAHELDARAGEGPMTESGATIAIGEPPDEPTLANDPAEIVAALWRATEMRIDDGFSLADALAVGRGGRRVRSIGLEDDLDDAARLDRFPIAAEVVRGPTRIVPATSPSGPRLRLFGA